MNEALQRINIILRHAENIHHFLDGICQEEWLGNKEKQCATMYSLMAVSENVKELLRLDESIRERYEAIPWSNIARFRDKMSHHYDKVDVLLVFEICQKHIASLADVIQEEKQAVLRLIYTQKKRVSHMKMDTTCRAASDNSGS